MTKKQRAQVVELLRHSAERTLSGEDRSVAPLTDTADIIYGKGREPRILATAREAVLSIRQLWCVLPPAERAELVLEAAARVEEGTWP